MNEIEKKCPECGGTMYGLKVWRYTYFDCGECGHSEDNEPEYEHEEE
jgi:DNA-directed RNA polymerase subunit M/transcription elongation factor TFIIS